MISRKHRFHGYGSLNYVYKNGQSVRATDCSLKFVKNEKRKSYRLAVVVSKKVHKSAVRRNRIRRRLYELMRLRLANSAEGCYDMVLSVFNERLLTISDPELSKTIDSLLKQASIVK